MCELLAGAFQIEKDAARGQAMVGGKDECLDKVNQYVKAGATHFIFMLIAPYDHDQVQGFAEEVVPAARTR